MIQIIPAILATSEEEYKEKLNKIRTSPGAKGWVQIDLMDNKFVQNESIGPDIIAKYPTSLKLEAQLMVEYPENWIDELVKIKVDRIIFPVEDTEGVKERIKHIKNHGIEVGLSLNPETAVDLVEPYLYDLDVVLVMGVNPGFGGQEFIPQVVPKIGQLKTLRPDLIIGVDGGINETNVKVLYGAGADYLVLGGALFKYDNLEEGLRKILEATHG